LPLNKKIIKGIRWFNRIVGSLLVLFVLFMFIGYAIEPQGTGEIKSIAIPLFAGMGLMVGGIIVAWFREGLGGLVTVGGFILFLGVELVSGRDFDAWFLGTFPIIGLLFLFCWWQSLD
jgi:hypothetical protein